MDFMISLKRTGGNPTFAAARSAVLETQKTSRQRHVHCLLPIDRRTDVCPLTYIPPAEGFQYRLRSDSCRFGCRCRTELEKNLKDAIGKKWEITGFLDSKKDNGGFPAKYPLLDNEDSFEFKEGDLIVLAIADPDIKERLYHKLREKVQFFTFVHPSSRVLDYSTIGEGTIIYPNCFISSNVSIGRLVTINNGSQIGHDASIGDYSSLMAHVDLGGGVILGNNSFMGTQSAIAPYKKIASHTKISIGSIVMRSTTRPGCTLLGNPAVKFE